MDVSEFERICCLTLAFTQLRTDHPAERAYHVRLSVAEITSVLQFGSVIVKCVPLRGKYMVFYLTYQGVVVPKGFAPALNESHHSVS